MHFHLVYLDLREHITEDSTGLRAPMNANFRPAKFQWWWDAIIDEMMANPQITKAEIASKLNVTPTYIYMVTCSDLFQAHYHARRRALNDGVGEALQTELLKVANKSLGLIHDQLDLKKTAIPLQSLVDVADKTLSRLGYGVPKAQPTLVQVNTSGGAAQVNVPQVSASDLEEARRALRQSQTRLVVDNERSEDAAVRALAPQAAHDGPFIPPTTPSSPKAISVASFESKNSPFDFARVEQRGAAPAELSVEEL